KEVSKDLHDLYLYFEILNCSANGNLETLTLRNTLFTELHSSQTNIVSIEFGESNQTLRFTKDQIKQRITLN
ncbi:MAG: hypothetical protein HRU26_17755, partial [Psychroserpens sp.]|nr:hypothetical protein [Psychroserpens sp.]